MDNKLVQYMLIGACILLLIAIVMTWADILRHGSPDSAVSRSAPAPPALPA